MLPPVEQPADDVATQAGPATRPLKKPSVFDSVPISPPLPQAVEHGVFGMTDAGPMPPDDDQIRSVTVEQAHELVGTLAEIQAVEDGQRTGENPRTGRIPKTTEQRERLMNALAAQERQLKQSYADTLGAYEEGFGAEAAQVLDAWVRMTVADQTIGADHFSPGHPWHYLPEGDNADPVPLAQIEPNLEMGKYIESDLPKNPVKRIAKLRELLSVERERVERDKCRYQEIAERGAEALSTYDRTIAHTSDAMARATALSLKYNHLCYGLGRVAWLEKALGLNAKTPVASFRRRDD